MAHLLHLNSSPRGERSRSRRFTRELVDAWKYAHPGDTVTYRDIGRNPVPHLDERWVAAAYTYQDPYLRTIFGFIGITDITFIHVENDESGSTGLANSIAHAQTQIAQWAAV